MDKPPIITHLHRPGDPEYDFDREYWKRMSPLDRLAAAAQMVDEAYQWKGLGPDAAVFHRTIVRIQRPATTRLRILAPFFR